LINRYTHLKLNQDIEAVAGHYTPRKEVRLKHNGREVLYIVSEAVVDSACCGSTDFTSVLVPGYIVRWQAELNRDGLPVSEVEPITDKAAQGKIRKLIQATEPVSQIEFW
jgi:hypothetical protein